MNNIYNIVTELQELNDQTLISDVLVESLSAEEEARLRKNLKIPTIRPAVEDVTMEAWLKRLEIIWGHVNIIYEDPDTKTKRKLTQAQFIKEVNNSQFIKMFGKFDIQELEINKVCFSRSYVGFDGKKKVERYIIEVDLKDELKKALKKWF